MSILPAPVVTPAGVVNTTAVTVTPNYTDPRPDDTTMIRWGVYTEPAQTGADVQTPQRIPAAQICDGSATVWFSAKDKANNMSYSATTTAQIQGSGHMLARPSLSAVNQTNPALGMIAAIITVNNIDPDFSLNPADLVTFQVSIYNTVGGDLVTNYLSGPYFASTLNNGTSPPLSPVPSDDQTADVTYTVSKSIAMFADPVGEAVPAQNQLFNSQAVLATGKQLFPAADTLPAPIFTDAQSGILSMNQIQAGKDIGLQIPTAALVNGKQVQFTGSGAGPDLINIPAAAWLSAQVTVAATPYSGTSIPRAKVDAVPDGGTYSVFYTVGANTSPATTVLISRPTVPPPGTTNGTIFGWGNTTWGTLGS